MLQVRPTLNMEQIGSENVLLSFTSNLTRSATLSRITRTRGYYMIWLLSDFFAKARM